MGYCAQVYDHYISTFTNQFTLKVWFCSNNLDVQDADATSRDRPGMQQKQGREVVGNIYYCIERPPSSFHRHN